MKKIFTKSIVGSDACICQIFRAYGLKSLLLFTILLFQYINVSAQYSAAPCNAYSPWVSSTYTMSVDNHEVLFVDDWTNKGQLIDNNLDNFATWTTAIAGSTWIEAQNSPTAGQEFPAGSYAGFVVEDIDLVSLGSSFTITTYKNNTMQDTKTYSSLIGTFLDDGVRKVGLITTLPFNRIRLTVNVSAAVLFSVKAYYAEIVGPCAGPSLACNVNTSLNQTSFGAIIEPTRTRLSGIGLGSINDAPNVLTSNPNDSATIILNVGIAASANLSVRDLGDVFAGGTFAGFEVRNASLLSLSLLSSTKITTYLNGVPRDSVEGNNLLLTTSLLNSSNRQIVGFITTNTFDEIRYSLKQTIGADLGTTYVYNAVVKSFCNGPALTCNTSTFMTEPQYPMVVDAMHTGITGGACLSCEISNSGNIIDANTSNFASIYLTRGVDITASIGLAFGTGTSMSAGTYVGFDVVNPTFVGVNILNGLSVTTYENGSMRESINSGNGLISTSSSLLNGLGAQRVGFVTSLSFDAVSIGISQVIGLDVGTTELHNLVLKKFCAGTLACNVLTPFTEPSQSVYVDYKNTGIDVIGCVACQLNNTENVIDNNPSNFASLIMAAGVATTANFAVADPLVDYPAGSFAGFDLEYPTVLAAGVISSATIQLYYDDNLVQSGTGNALLVGATTSILSGISRQIVGITALQPFNKVKIEFNQLAGADLGTIKIYSAILQKSCAFNLQCNTTYKLTGSDFGAVINSDNTGIANGVCALCKIEDPWFVTNNDTLDFAKLRVVAGVLAKAQLSVQYAAAVGALGVNDAKDFPQGSFAGFYIRDNNFIIAASLLTAITISTYNNGVFVESKTGTDLLDLTLLLSIFDGSGSYKLGFVSTAPFDEIKISVGSLVNVIEQNIDVFYAFVDTRTALQVGVNACGNDTDGDMIVDLLDIDDDNDGILDVIEGTGDADGDGIPNYLDLDSDNDGINDVIEGGGSDPDNNGIIGTGQVPTDTDGDGLADVADPDNGGTLLTKKDTDGDGVPDTQDLDSDNDGITDVRENGLPDGDNDGIIGTGLIMDSDGDGILDIADNQGGFGDLGNMELPTDSDGDGIPNAYDLDSDNDGITDVVENGLPDGDNDGIIGTGPIADGDGDGILDVADQQVGFGDLGNLEFPADFDGDGIPNANDLDSDNDGITDVIEAGGTDLDNNGLADGGDSDGDGIPNSADQFNGFGDAGNTDIATNTDHSGGPDYLDLDSDNDGINDVIESGGSDPDNNGIIGSGAITDTDGDGLADSVDPNNGGVLLIPRDTDGDLIPDTQDLDSDNDGITDVVENGLPDGDNDGIIGTGPIADADGDGILDVADQQAGFGDFGNLEFPTDFDGDDIPNAYDLDSDNDGITDVIEAGGIDLDNNGLADGVDTDGDGIPNSADQFNGFGDAGNTDIATNTDHSGGPDYLDLDSDNDGITDVVENGLPDGDNDGIIGTGPIADADGDGILDVADQQAGFGDAGNTNLEADFDGDGIPNANDLDSDNDGITDVIEAGGTDNDNNGLADGGDSDGDGIPNSADQFNGFGDSGNTDIATNTDNSGGPDYLDLDSDNDGITDVVENGLPDGDNDGIIGSGPIADSDGDGILDVADQQAGFGDAGNTNFEADFDGDMVPNSRDIDSDDDGLTDAAEAGILDADNNGLADGADSDGDGILDGADQFNGFGDAGNTDVPPNTDNTGKPNYLDIDSDDDGIVDNIEWQSTSSYIAPSGTDTDNDGLDDAYDDAINLFGDAGNNDTPVNTDNTDNPDYLDLNSDNSEQNDAIEGWDTNNNGTANTLPSGNDADGDGLDDAYDVNDAFVDPTNGNIPQSFPNLDGGTAERDWREAIKPDLTINTSINPNQAQGDNIHQDVRILVREILNYPTNGTAIYVSIPASSKYVLLPYNATLTEIDGLPVANSQWSYIGINGGFHYWQYIDPSNVIAANGITAFGVGMTWFSGNQDGTLNFEATIFDNSGGDTNVLNNRDGEVINFNK